MPTTRSNRSSVHSEINAAGSPLAVPLPVHTSSTPSTVAMTTPSTSVGSSSTTSILSPDVHLLLQTVRDLSNTSKSIQTMADLNSEELLQPLQQFNCTNSSEFLAWARRVQEHLRCIPCFSLDILIKPREEISFSVSTDQIDFMYNFVWNRLFKSISHNAELLSRLNRITKPDVKSLWKVLSQRYLGSLSNRWQCLTGRLEPRSGVPISKEPKLATEGWYSLKRGTKLNVRRYHVTN